MHFDAVGVDAVVVVVGALREKYSLKREKNIIYFLNQIVAI